MTSTNCGIEALARLDALGPLAEPQEIAAAAATLPPRAPMRRFICGYLDGLACHWSRGTWSDHEYREGWFAGWDIQQARRPAPASAAAAPTPTWH